MTTTVANTIIMQGPGNFNIQLFIQSDGLDGELVNYVIFDPAVDAQPPVNPWHPQTMVVSLQQVWHSQSWFDVVLSYNALEPTPVWIFTRDTNPYEDFRYIGGLLDWSGAQRDGKILISTIGLAGVISTGSLVLSFKKQVN